MENKIKIVKKDGKVTKVEINGNEILNVIAVYINNNYATDNIAEEVTIKLADISTLEVITNS